MKKGLKYKIGKGLSGLFRLWFLLRYGSHVSWGKGVIVNHRFKFSGKGKLIIGDDVNLWAHKEPNEFHTYTAEAEIKIGARSRLNGVGIQCRQQVLIGEDCLIGSAVIMDNDFHSVNFEERNGGDGGAEASEAANTGAAGIKTAPVVIENKVWLAGQCAILKGVTVESEAVVGFRAVVSKDVAMKTVVAGNPAVVVKHLDNMAHDCSALS